MKNKTNSDIQSIIRYVYIWIEIILYVVFIIQDLRNVPSNRIKYMSIGVCVAAALYLLVKRGEKLIFATMILTLFADTFLLLLGKYYFIGVLAFSIVQTLYAGRLIAKSTTKSIFPRIASFLMVLVVLKWFGILDWLTTTCAWSYTQLVANVIHGFLIKDKFQGGHFFAIGLLLFLACDTCVGINNLLEYIPGFAFPGILPFAAYLMWIFYLPSQVLIILSFWNKSSN